MRIGLFVTSLNTDYNKTPASYWIRILQMIDYYRDIGVEVYLNDYIRKYDVAILFRKSKPKYYFILKYLSLISKKVYFDTCINIFDLHEEIDSVRLKYARKIAKAADGLICASNRIAEHAMPYSNSVYVMEDPVNTRHFKALKEKINFDNPVFGWSGVGAKSVYLNRFAEQISGKIIIISEPQIQKVSLDFSYNYIPWNYESFPRDILSCDIALLPRDYGDSYNDSHSSFKALVFAASGIPIVANRVPSYADLSEYYDGIVFLEDFGNNLESCITELRNRSLDTSGVVARYSCESQAKGLIDYFESQLARKRG